MLLFLFVFTVSSVPMHNVHKMLRNRTMSMEDYDKPMKERKSSLSGGGSNSETGGGPSSPPASPAPAPISPLALGEGVKSAIAL